MLPERVLPWVWRWADPAGADRAGTALSTPDGVVVIDPPPLAAGGLAILEREAGAIRHVVLTSPRLASLAAPFRAAGVTVWLPAAPADPADSARAADPAGTDAPPGATRRFGVDGGLPGGLLVCALPERASLAGGGEVALFLVRDDTALLITGDILPVVGQVPVYREGAALPIDDFRDAIVALLAVEPDVLAPAHQAPPDPQVLRSTGYAAYVGTPIHRRRAAPVEGPRWLVPQAGRILQETLAAPVVMRRAVPGVTAGEPGDAGAESWTADPFACARCGRPNTPAVSTCGGPLIPRLCPACRVFRRQELPALRIMACAGGCCTRDGARAVLSTIRQAVAEEGLSEEVDVVPVSCLGECGIGPLVAVTTAQGREPGAATAMRQETLPRVLRYAEEAGETIDEESERVLARFAALVRPAEARRLVKDLAPARDRSPSPPAGAPRALGPVAGAGTPGLGSEGEQE